MESEIKKKLRHLKTTNIYGQFELERILVKVIVDRIKANPNYLERKNDISLVKFVCLNIEEVITNKKKGLKTDKLALCLDVFDKLFVMSDEDKRTVINCVESFHTDGHLVKSNSAYKMIINAAFWICKKIC